MASDGEGCAHLARVDRCYLMREEVDHHRGARLEAASDAGGEYDPLVSSR